MIETYQEVWTYEWKPSKAKFWEVEAVDTKKDLLPAEFYKHGEYIYVIDEKQLYRAVHKRSLEFLGMREESIK